ncbi:hypothetical protein F5880DRAFT_716938 [Lentinula raphanica]|nr:hypothetical protein F5880DRAFT_716938 [Lentinula raphanica]
MVIQIHRVLLLLFPFVSALKGLQFGSTKASQLPCSFLDFHNQEQLSKPKAAAFSLYHAHIFIHLSRVTSKHFARTGSPRIPGLRDDAVELHENVCSEVYWVQLRTSGSIG